MAGILVQIVGENFGKDRRRTIQELTRDDRSGVTRAENFCRKSVFVSGGGKDPADPEVWRAAGEKYREDGIFVRPMFRRRFTEMSRSHGEIQKLLCCMHVERGVVP